MTERYRESNLAMTHRVKLHGQPHSTQPHRADTFAGVSVRPVGLSTGAFGTSKTQENRPEDVMSYFVLTCDGYKVESTWPTLKQAIAECQSRERDTDDGFARVVSLDGQIIADAEGFYSDPEGYVDAATQTGMYDAW